MPNQQKLLSLSSQSKFVHSNTDLIVENKSKIKEVYIYRNNFFTFLYNIKTTNLREFPNLYICNVNNFCLKTKVTIKL